MVELADMNGARIIGPNCLGLIVPGVCKMGGIGGPAKDAAKAYEPGSIGVMSRSGGMTTEISSSLTAAGLGVSTAVSIGGDAIIGSTYAELMPLFEADEQTEAILTLGPETLEHVGDHVGDVAELGDAEAAGGAGRRADADAAGLDRGQGIERDAVLVAGDRRALERLVGVFAGDAQRPEVDQCEMGVGAAGDEIGAALLEAAGERLGVGDHRLGVGLEVGLQRLAERHRLGGNDVHQRAALEAGEDR